MDSKRVARLVLAFWLGVFISFVLVVPWAGSILVFTALVLVLTAVVLATLGSLLWAIAELIQ